MILWTIFCSATLLGISVHYNIQYHKNWLREYTEMSSVMNDDRVKTKEL